LITFSLHGKGVPPEMAAAELEAVGESIGGLIARVMEAKPGLRKYLTTSGKLRTDITILVNGRHCMFMDGLETKLNKGDRIDVLLPMIGG
jgi:molybdopterin converting factor small subunit